MREIVDTVYAAGSLEEDSSTCVDLSQVGRCLREKNLKVRRS